MALTENERSIITFLLNDARIKDSEVSRRLGISLQAVRKIRKKLENRGFIRGYIPRLDYEKLGINVFVIALLKINPERKVRIKDIKESMCGKSLIKLYSVHKSNTTHILHLGFRNINDFSNFSAKFQSVHSNFIELKALYVLSNKDILYESDRDLVTFVMSQKP